MAGKAPYHLAGWMLTAVAVTSVIVMVWSWMRVGEPDPLGIAISTVLCVFAAVWPYALPKPGALGESSTSTIFLCADCGAPRRGFPRMDFCLRCGGTSVHSGY
jgi:hypothetical protein